MSKLSQMLNDWAVTAPVAPVAPVAPQKRVQPISLLAVFGAETQIVPTQIQGATGATGATEAIAEKPPLPWWRDPIELCARFDEIAGQAEYDNGADRDAAERIAHECLYVELTDAGQTREAAIRRANEASKPEARP